MKLLILFITIILSFIMLFSSKEVVILYTGNINGMIRDCGCSGEDLGGFARIKTYVDKERQSHPNVYLIDIGNAFSISVNDQKNYFIIQLMQKLNYNFVMKSELEHQSGIDSESFFFQNKNLFNYVSRDSTKIISYDGDSDFLIYQGSLDSANLYAERHQKSIIFLSHSYDLMDSVIHNRHFYQIGADGEYIGKLTVKKSVFGFKVLKNEFVKLDEKTKEDSAFKLAIDNYYDSMEYSYKQKISNNQQIYYGAEQCKACHSDIYYQWKESNHAHAFETLKRENRAFDDDCIKCHNTGYQNGGYRNPIDTPKFTDVQCEACHENLPFDHYLASQKLNYHPVDETRCLNCHTPKNSPQFDYLRYLAKIKHWQD